MRTETTIGEGPVSVVAAVVELARAVHGDLDRCSALLIGTGELGELLASGLRAAGLPRIIVTDTRQARAEIAARLLDCHLLPIEDLADAAPRADIIVGCLGGREPAVTVEMARSALRRRRNQPIVMIDAALPGDVDPLVDRLDGIFLYTLDDLERVARDGRKARLEAVGQARSIVEQEVVAFLRQRAERAAVPALLRLRDRFESERVRALADARGDAEKATRLLINRLLHDPTRRLREIAGRRSDDDDEVARIGELLVRLFTVADESDKDER